jgi:hypothetical protein
VGETLFGTIPWRLTGLVTILGLSGKMVQRMVSDDRFMVNHYEIGRDEMFAVYTARLDALQEGIFLFDK